MPAAASIRALLVDDDPKYRDMMTQGLGDCGLLPTAVGDAGAARAALAAASFDVVLLDVMMPGDDGTTLLRDLRARGIDVPVLLVTARGAVEERVAGLRLGADDYVVKPFSFAELLARIEAVVRRRRAATAGAGELCVGGLRILPLVREATCNGRRVDLSPKEFDLLRALAAAHGEVSTRSELLRGVWRMEHDPGTNVVDVHVARLRRKLEVAGGPAIDTVRGRGYRLRDSSPSPSPTTCQRPPAAGATDPGAAHVRP